MKGFAEVSVVKVKRALDNYNKMSDELRGISEKVNVAVKEEVQNWGWLAKKWYLEGANFRAAFVDRYSDGWADVWTVFYEQELITKEVLCSYNKHTEWRNKMNAKYARELSEATTENVINVGEELAAWINTYSEVIPVEQ